MTRLPDPAALVLESQAPIPVTVLTGFLGSGKTTIVKRLLATEVGAGTAVIVNEFGEVGLDHRLLETATEDVVLLPGGCLCCETRGDLARALHALLERRERGELPPYDRVVIETSGAADPGPILMSFLGDPLRLSRYRLAGLVTLVDAVLGPATIRAHQAAERQVRLADRILVSKLDLAGTGGLGSIRAEVSAAAEPTADGIELLPQLFDFATPRAPGASPLPGMGEGQGEGKRVRASPVSPQPESRRGSDALDGVGVESRHHHHRFASIVRRVPARLSLERLHQGIAAMADRHGEHLLRLKGIVNVEDDARSVAVHAVQHLVHRPCFLARSIAPEDAAVVAIAPIAAMPGIASDLDRLIRSAAARHAG